MTLTVRLESSTENALTHFCDSHALSKSQVVHRALNDWLKVQTSGKSHALLAYVPNDVPQQVRLKSQTSDKSVNKRKAGAAYEAYSKAALHARVSGASAGKA